MPHMSAASLISAPLRDDRSYILAQGADDRSVTTNNVAHPRVVFANTPGSAGQCDGIRAIEPHPRREQERFAEP